LLFNLNHGWLGGMQAYLYRVVELFYYTDTLGIDFWLSRLINYFDDFLDSQLFDLSDIIFFEKSLPLLQRLLSPDDYERHILNCLLHYKKLDDVIGVMSIHRLLEKLDLYKGHVELKNEISNYICFSGYSSPEPASILLKEKVEGLNERINKEIIGRLCI